MYCQTAGNGQSVSKGDEDNEEDLVRSPLLFSRLLRGCPGHWPTAIQFGAGRSQRPRASERVTDYIHREQKSSRQTSNELYGACCTLTTLAVFHDHRKDLRK